MSEDKTGVARWAAAYFNGDFYCIETCSGESLTVADPQGILCYLATDASDKDLGIALQSALEKSRIVHFADEEFYNHKNGAERYYKWVRATMVKYGYKTEREMFENMKNCSVTSKSGLLTIEPSNHDSLEGWSGDGLTPSDDVTIDADSTPEQIGSALRLAFERCIG